MVRIIVGVLPTRSFSFSQRHDAGNSFLRKRGAEGDGRNDWDASSIASQDNLSLTSLPSAGNGRPKKGIARLFRRHSPKEHTKYEDHLSGSRNSGFEPSVVHDSSIQSDISSVFADWGKRALKLGKVAKEIGQSLYPPRPDYLMESLKPSGKEPQPGQMWNENSDADADTLHYPDEDESLHLDGKEDR